MSDVKTYVNALLLDAKCFRCLPEATLWEVQTYLWSYIAGYRNVDPNALALAAKAMSRLSPQTLLELKAFLLAFINQTGTDPNVMIANARCFDCIPLGMQMDAQTYLLANDSNGPGITNPNALALAAKSFQGLSETTLLEIQIWLIAGIAGVSQDPNDLAALNKCTKCVPLPMLSAIASQSLEYREPIPADSARNGLTTPPVDDGRGGTGRGRGGGIPTCTDVAANLIPVLTPVYLAGVINTVSARLPKVCCNPDHIDFYQADDAIGTGAVLYATRSLAGTHPGEANHIETLNIAVTPTKLYLLAKQVCSNGTVSAYSTAVANFIGTTEANDWATRVVANGGAMPSANSITAAGNFVASLKLAGIFTKMHAVNMFAPDSLIAAITPIIKNLGFDPWTNSNFVAGDLSVNGLTGNPAGNKALNIGILPTSLSLTTAGMTAVVTIGTAENQKVIMGEQDGAGANIRLITNNSGTGNSEFDCWDAFAAGGFVSTANKGLGYYSGNRTAANAIALYFAKTGTPHSAVATGNATAGARGNTNRILCFALGLAGPSTGAYTAERIPFAAVHQGLTATESLALFNAVQALRTAFGGGTV